MSVRESVTQTFRELFGAEPALRVRAPGRVNVIGEHTDYNGGFVLPMAIDREVWIALRARGDTTVDVYSESYGERLSFDLGQVVRGGDSWIEYIKGVASVMMSEGDSLRGWEGVIGGDLPSGAGMSSSAALELAVARAFTAVTELPWQPLAAARLGQRVENEWIGVNSGIMDQAVIAAGQRAHALLIDCRSLDITPVPLPTACAVVVLDTGTRRGLVDSAYNERRQQCDDAARFFGVSELRDVDAATFAARAGDLDDVTRRRARHVITENARTLAAAAAMREGDVARLGGLMNASHASLRGDFEVTNDALDTIVALAHAHADCYGARMTGAGFGGCAIALVREESADVFIDDIARQYKHGTGLTPSCYVCHAADGVRVE